MSDYSELKRRALDALECQPPEFQKDIDTAFERSATPGVVWGLIGELEVAEKIIAERNRLLDAIPACPVHGHCVPYAIEWVEKAMLMIRELKAENAALRKDVERFAYVVREQAIVEKSKNGPRFWLVFPNGDTQAGVFDSPSEAIDDMMREGIAGV